MLDQRKSHKPSKWIHAVSIDLPKSTLINKKRYCGLCKTQMLFHEEADAWICRNTKCAGVLKLGHGIGPVKGEQEELVTIDDPYGDLQKPFVKAIANVSQNKLEHGLQRPLKEKKARSASDAVRTW
jgi:hypothetical protein